MAVIEAERLRSMRELRAEIHELRRGLLPVFAFPLLATPLLWLAYASVRDWSARGIHLVDLAVFQLVCAVYLVMRLRENHHCLACWALLLTLTAAQCLVVAAYPEPLTMAFGACIVVVSQALAGPGPALAAAVAVWGACAGASAWVTGSASLSFSTIAVLWLYLLIWATTWLSGRPLTTSISWALEACQQARELLAETRARRAELYRALRALEEATYRIERMNGELLVARHQAEEARAHKARFVATVSHELRGPLNLILGYSRLMVMSPERYRQPLPRDYRADVATIYRNSQHLADLVDDILDLSQIEAERLPLVKEQVDLEAEVIRAAVDIVRPLAERKGLALREELAGGLPLLLVDPIRLRQVMLNILTNAIRFTERGHVVVRSRRQDDHVIVSVEDTGPGIAPERMSRLFQEFSQMHLVEGDEPKGSGLGLSISKYLVELHGGRIWAESRLGQGTTLYCALPLPGAAPGALPMVHTGDAMGRTHGSGPFVVVHGDPGVARLLTRYLESYRVVGVAEADEVAPLVEQLHPRAVLTDAGTAPAIYDRLMRQGFDVPVISCVMPGLSERPDAERAMGYLIKPIAPESVAALVRRVERNGETKVLLVDDDPDAVRLLEIMLTSLPRPYRILKAYDGREALEVMQRHVPDLVFLDLLMPGLDGEGTLARMRADERLRDVPVVIISARDVSEGVMTLGTPISVRCHRPVDISRAARCLQAILHELAPDYLGEDLLAAC